MPGVVETLKLAVVHGYFLSDSGSAVFVRELTRSFIKQGHDVTLVCQERHPENYDFIDSSYVFDPENREPSLVFEREARYPGRCRLVRPDIHNNLLTYVKPAEGSLSGWTFQEAPFAWIRAYVEDNVRALTKTFDLWPPDAVQANHAIMQPYEVNQALRGRAPYVMTVHGSALNFSVRNDARLMPYFLEGAREAKTIVALSQAGAEETAELAAAEGLHLRSKTRIVTPGVDVDLWHPAADRDAVLKKYLPGYEPGDAVAAFAGRLLWTKGPQHIIAALPFVNMKGRNLKVVLAGEGPLAEPLRYLIKMLDEGRVADAKRFLKETPVVEESTDFGPVMPELSTIDESLYTRAAIGKTAGRVAFLGHLAHDELAPVLGAADLLLAPSVFTEAYGLSVIEGLAAGALPVATYHSGLMAPLDIVTLAIKDPVIRGIKPGADLTKVLAETIVHCLDLYPTREVSFRNKLHDVAVERFSWAKTAEEYIMLFKGV